MSVYVTEADDALERWDEHVSRSRQGSVFHQLSAARVLAKHTDTKCHHLVGYDGDELVGLFPLFETRIGAINAVFSPPPDLRIPFAGPVLLYNDRVKQRKAELRHRQFIEACLDWIDVETSPRYIHFRTGTRYPDLRTFQWNGFEVTPEYTYVVDLSVDDETLLSSFSSDARNNIRTEDATTVEGGVDALKWIIERVRDRYAAQDIPYHVNSEFVEDLYKTLPPGQVRPYITTHGGKRAGGIVTLEYGDTVQRWQGGTRPDVDVPVNDLLDWRIMQDARERDRMRYDLVGASTPRLNEYKAKFDPDVKTYHRIERSNKAFELAVSAYTKLR